MTRIFVLSTAVFLAACGSGGGGGAPAEEITTPAPVPQDSGNLPPGYNADGTIPPATEAPVTEEPAPEPKPCKIPQAAEEGIEHGQPPIGRCD